MNCETCDAYLPDDARFCSHCGSVVATAEAAPDKTTATIDSGAFDPSVSVGDAGLTGDVAVLVVVRGPNAGDRFLLDRDVTTVGRHPESVIFLDDVTVSRNHCEVTRADSAISVADQASLNGTYVNGERVEQATLHGGDELQVGRFKLMLLTAQQRDSGHQDGAA